MHNLALSQEESGNLDAARQTMERVKRLRLQMFGARHFLYADSMFALGHILLKLASSNEQSKGGSWWGSGQPKQGLERQGLRLMQDAIAILEDAGEKTAD